jgi:hypothetical protein
VPRDARGGSDELLALVQEHERRERVLDQQRLDHALGADLRDREAARGFVETDVLERRRARRITGNERQPAR